MPCFNYGAERNRMASDCRERRGKFLPSRSDLAGLGQITTGDGSN